jgi:hypothetical protein
LLASGSALLTTLGLTTLLSALVVSSADEVACGLAALVNLVGELSSGRAVRCVCRLVEALIGYILSLFRVDGILGLVCEISDSHGELLFSNVMSLSATAPPVLDSCWDEARENKEYCVMLAQVSALVHMSSVFSDNAQLMFRRNYVSVR